ncbi:hypothetical protein MCOR27_004006 [Pyricularia oryzae]|uniref:Uncharacterized protein n=2 Tax=Pyricularia TaxID=48558 RepID=A0ABQ8P173_PYRGI|nr:hypothetical protein MCOR01_011384 [Pyricularia oryzae]KAI6305074.1 hypothetical protein MCOR33_000191 [Pyricularia grisea]KAH9437518.1 hypothetical protein MCOR02_001175 [Pyricularia oryzae]KAI6256073.1 hypothetical protein MCOR19_007442 [Pyricularia oryzae]KAI6266145.1 hypothetical protein MCOR26_010346 [Pyricularia oryzae]
MFRAIWRRPWVRNSPRFDVVHLHKTNIREPWLSRNLGKCTATFACAYIMLYLFERKLAEIDMESIQKHEEDLHFPGIFLPLPHFEVLTQPKGFPRNGPVWERYTRFVEDESRRQAANVEIIDKVSNAYKAPGTPWVKRFGPPLSVNAHLTIILPGGPNPEPYQLGMVLLDDNEGPLFRRRLVTRNYWKRVERVFHPQALFMASLAFMSCLWDTTVVEVKQAMGVETEPAKPAQPQQWSLRNVPVWSPDPPKQPQIRILGPLPTGLPPAFGTSKPVVPQSTRPGAPKYDGAGKASSSSPLPLVTPSGISPPTGEDNSQSLTKNTDKDQQQQPRPGWTDEEGNPLMPLWLDYMANPQTHAPLMKRMQTISQAPRAAFLRELSRYPAWRPQNTHEYPPQGSIRLVGPVVVTTPGAYVHLEVSYWYDPATRKVIDQGSEISLKAVGHRWDAKNPQQVQSKPTADKWEPVQGTEKNVQPREPPERKE